MKLNTPANELLGLALKRYNMLPARAFSFYFIITNTLSHTSLISKIWDNKLKFFSVKQWLSWLWFWDDYWQNISSIVWNLLAFRCSSTPLSVGWGFEVWGDFKSMQHAPALPTTRTGLTYTAEMYSTKIIYSSILLLYREIKFSIIINVVIKNTNFYRNPGFCFVFEILNNFNADLLNQKPN